MPPAPVNLDRVEKNRRNTEVADFAALVRKYKNDTVNGRSLTLTDWKKKRIENWKKTFGNMSSIPAHVIIPDESVLMKEMEIRVSSPIASGTFSHTYPARIRVAGKSVDAAIKVLR